MASSCLHVPTVSLSQQQRSFSRSTASNISGSSPLLSLNGTTGYHLLLNCRTPPKLCLSSALSAKISESSTPRFSQGIVACTSGSGHVGKLSFSECENSINGEPFRGKSGYVSFTGSSHQSVEESKTVSAPFKENTGSIVWILAPVALISSLIVPQLLLGLLGGGLIQDEVLSDMVAFFVSEVMFYVGLATFLRITDHVQRPYLQYSSKRWSLITGLKGYLVSSFFTMGVKVLAPLFVVYVTWPMLGLPALVAVAPFLAGCLVQFVFEKNLDTRASSCWPLVPIIFEVYRLYQLTRAAHFIEKLMFTMRGNAVTPAMLERHGALVALLVIIQILGLVCLWSLLSFLIRLFPSRPVVENY